MTVGRDIKISTCPTSKTTCLDSRTSDQNVHLSYIKKERMFLLLPVDDICAVYFSMLQGLVDFDGYYLESDPCLVCNNPEVPYQVCKNSTLP